MKKIMFNPKFNQNKLSHFKEDQQEFNLIKKSSSYKELNKKQIFDNPE